MEEWEAVLRFVQALEEEIKYPEMTDEQLREFVEKAPVMFRVVFGYQVLVDNCCDPAADTLEWKPDIAEAIAAAKAKRETAEVAA